jgi:hypothetical protein
MKLPLTDTGIQNSSIEPALADAPTHHDRVHHFRQIRMPVLPPEPKLTVHARSWAVNVVVRGSERQPGGGGLPGDR